jgi:serine/threonine protein kinase
MEMPRVGTDFAGYQVQGIVGRGGMSVVYQAEHPRLARIVALKVLSVELSEDDRFRERFVRESRLAASLDHPNIIPIYDAGASDDLLYIAMRFVKGDLKAVIQREGRLRPERLMPVFTQIASALDAAHHLGLVHRDVKPANVLIAFSSGPDGRDHVYLADFGLTKHANSRSGITGTGQFVGTVDYMAPEQIEGKQVDGRVDVYALGCIAYECLTGRVPFTRDTDAAVIWAHLKEDPPKVSSVAGNVPPEVDEVIGKAMAKSVEDRYDSCMQLLVALREALDFSPAGSQRASAAPPLRSETVLRERPGEAASQAPVPPSTVYPPAPLSAPPSFAPPPEIPFPQEAPASQAGVAPSPYEGRSEVSPPTAEPAPPRPPPAAPAAPAAPSAPPQVSPGEEKRRGRVLGLVALIAVLLVGGAVAFMFLDDTGPGGVVGQASGGAATEQALVARTTTDLSAVGPFPDAVESLFLVAHVGPENIVKWNCRRDASVEDSIRGLSCAPGDGISSVQYSLFHDGIRMRTYFGELQDSKGASRAGDCVGPDPWRGFWSVGPEVWGHALGSDKGEYKGQVLCFKSPTGEPHISWIDYSTKIFAEAAAPPGSEETLYYWWRQEAGPGHPTHIHSLQTGNTAAVEGQNVVSGVIAAVGRDATNNITSATIQNSSGKETEIFFDNRTYECPLFHIQEHKDTGTEVILPVERIDGQLVVTYFNHC